MHQTLLAFLSMMVATLAAYNQQLSAIRSQDAMIRSELEIMANAMGIQEMEIQAASAAWDDLDLLDDLQGTATFDVNGMSVDFSTLWNVQYVDDEGTLSYSPTDVKEVSVALTNTRYGFALVTHTRLFSDS